MTPMNTIGTTIGIDIGASAAMKRATGFEVIVNATPEATIPDRDPAQWHQAIGVARQACARIFRDGGRPADAVRAFGLSVTADDWSKAVTLIAQSLCVPALARAA